MTKPTSVSVFFPFLNDWGTVGSLVSIVIDTVSKITSDWEVILINDGSTKENREALGNIIRIINSSHLVNNRIKIVDHKANSGYGGALRSGFNHATKDLVFYTDCDAQYDPRELTKLYEALRPDIGMVNGYKIKRNDPLHRIIMGRIYHYTVKFFFKLPIKDTDCDFRLIRKQVFEKVKLYESTGTICVELVKKIDHAGYKIAQVPVHHYWRTSGKSQFFNFSRLSRTATNILKLWWKLMIKGNFA
jgi:glycosyltransferase involved in cell wall biosynthesis